jgi:hypothetical protein
MLPCLFIHLRLFYQAFILFAINEQIQNIAQKKDTLCRRMYN